MAKAMDTVGGEGGVIPENDWVTLLKDNARTGGSRAPALPSPGKARWQMRVGGSVRTAPALRDGTLYVTTKSGNLHAIQAENGRQKWKFKAGGPINSSPSLTG